MLIPKTAPYGSWKSPITSDLIAAQSISLSEPRLDGEQVYWLEGRPQELGRCVVVRASLAGGHGADVTPSPYNARTRVHEYGGASWTVVNGNIYFSNFTDGRLYWQSINTSQPEPLTPEAVKRERHGGLQTASSTARVSVGSACVKTTQPAVNRSIRSLPLIFVSQAARRDGYWSAAMTSLL